MGIIFFKSKVVFKDKNVYEIKKKPFLIVFEGGRRVAGLVLYKSKRRNMGKYM